MRKPRAFTIAELLVVIAIMTALVTLLVPSLQRIRKIGKRTLCSANLVDLTRAMKLYANENKDVLPPHAMSTEEYPERWWGYDGEARDEDHKIIDNDQPPRGEIFMYAKNERVFRCPTLISGEVGKSGVVLEWELTSRDVGYGYNAYFLGWYGGSPNAEPPTGPGRPDKWCHISYIKETSQVIVLSDATIRTGTSGPDGSFVTWWPAATTTNDAGVYPRHLDRANVAMLDGGVRQMYPLDVHDTTAGGKPQFWDPRYPR